MISKLYLVTDLGPGDGGKGGVVHKIANTFHASAVLKFGGGQGSHGVVTDSGEKFCFSHWGCGTLEGIPTYVTRRFVTIPCAILDEGGVLEHMGLSNPYKLLTISPNCICATPLHKCASQLRELIRRDQPRGTVGSGAGAAYRMAEAWRRGEDVPPPIKMSYIMRRSSSVFSQLQEIAKYYRKEFASYRNFDFLPEDQGEANKLLYALYDDSFVDWTLRQFEKLSQKDITLTPMPQYLASLNGNCVAECSHGVLTDAEVGFHPHVSAIRTLPDQVITDLRDAGYEGKIVRLGVTRAYAIRHGAGPLPTNNDNMLSELLPGSHKNENRWQGKVRVGALDFDLLRYAVDRSGSFDAFDGICVTWADQILKSGKWQYCAEYEKFSGLYTTEGLRNVRPVIQTVDVSSFDRDQLTQLITSEFWKQLHIPVRMISYGPDDQNKIFL